jgi:hypothetical protein
MEPTQQPMFFDTQGNLLIGGVHSPNYVSGIAGWAVNQDGSSEFSNATIRGTLLGVNFIANSKGFFFYNGTPAAGNLIGSIAAAAGVDDFGNAFSRVFNVGSQTSSHFGVDGTGIVYFVNAANQNVIQVNPNKSAVFVYTGTPALGNLATSIAVTAGTDPVGNNYPSGIMSTDGSRTIRIAGGQITTYSNTTPADFSYFTYNGGGRLDISSGIDTLAGATSDLLMIMTSGTPTLPGNPPQLNIRDHQGVREVDAYLSGDWFKTSNTGVPLGVLNPTLNANWSQATTFNGSTGWDVFSVIRLPTNAIHIYGAVKSAAGAGATICNLPAEYRPLFGQEPVPVLRNNAGVISSYMMGLSTSGNLNNLAATGGGMAAGNEFLFNAIIPLNQ